MYRDNQNLRQYARNLRQSQTYGEMKLWSKIKGKQLLNYKFRRQHILDKYIVDFFCNDINLIIEIDGLSHDELRVDNDERRDNYLKEKGYRLLRFSEREVLENVDQVIQSIVNVIFVID